MIIQPSKKSPLASASKPGLMSPSDKNKLDEIDIMTGATPDVEGTSGLVPVPAAGDQDKFLKADGTWGTPTDTKYSEATTSKAGLMSAADKAKLDEMSGDSSSSTRKSIVIDIDNTTDIDIPFTINDTKNLVVYLNGILLVPSVHYTATTSQITLTGYTAMSGDIVTFVGNDNVSTSVDILATEVGIQDTANNFPDANSVENALIQLADQGKVLKEYIDKLQTNIDNMQENIVTDYTSDIVISDSSLIHSLWSTAVKKIGHNVNFVVNVTVNSYNGNSIKIGYLPEAVRPIASVSVNTVTNTGIPCYIFVDRDGGFGVTKITGDTWSQVEGVRGCFSFMTTN